ncbi:MAG TPA: MmpS family transport accessory protein [Mycobacterium sp.]|nr:MmpS family transport accessory protein [Mycobacterium sp.]
MTDPRRPTGPGSDGSQWSQPTEPWGNQYPPADPAYAGTYAYPNYVPPNAAPPTQPLPPHWTQTQYPQYPPGPQQSEPQPPRPPKSPRWLWVLAGVALLLVVGLVVALVIANGSNRDDTVVAPLPTLPSTTTRTTPPRATTTPPATTSPRTTVPTPILPPLPPVSPPQTAATETVVYNVTGEGRAISITYVDTGGVLQMEFNVALPWTRQVAFTPSTVKAASVTVINVGREVSCSVTVNGSQVLKRSGNGLTICAGSR